MAQASRQGRLAVGPPARVMDDCMSRSVSYTSSMGRRATHPELGVGAVGMYTIARLLPDSSVVSPVRNPMLHAPFLGCSIMTTRLKPVVAAPENDSISCLAGEYTAPTMGVRRSAD